METGPARVRRSPLVAVVVLCLGAAVASPTQASDATPRKVTVKAGMEGDAETTETYLKANETFVREEMPRAVRACASAAEAGDVTSFDLTLTVATDGKIAGTTTNPTNAFTTCVSKAVASSVLTEPPRAPADVYLEITIAP